METPEAQNLNSQNPKEGILDFKKTDSQNHRETFESAGMERRSQAFHKVNIPRIGGHCIMELGRNQSPAS